jgi:hypothetical protein
MRNLDSCRRWRCMLCPCNVRQKFLIHFLNRTILLCMPCIARMRYSCLTRQALTYKHLESRTPSAKTARFYVWTCRRPSGLILLSDDYDDGSHVCQYLASSNCTYPAECCEVVISASFKSYTAFSWQVHSVAWRVVQTSGDIHYSQREC